MAGEINGTTAKNIFDAKENQIAVLYARIGGFQPNAAAASGRKCMCRSPTDIYVLINERG